MLNKFATIFFMHKDARISSKNTGLRKNLQILKVNVNKFEISWNCLVQSCNGFDIEFRQSFTIETFSYDEHFNSWNIQY